MSASARIDGGSAPAAQSARAAERALLSRAFARLDPLALGVALGLVAGVGLAVATAVLLLQGGTLVGLHLMRLSYYLPGYSVSWGGVLVGLVEGGLAGALLGAALAWLWNAYHRMFVAVVVLRERTRDARRVLQEP